MTPASESGDETLSLLGQPAGLQGVEPQDSGAWKQRDSGDGDARKHNSSGYPAARATAPTSRNAASPRKSTGLDLRGAVRHNAVRAGATIRTRRSPQVQIRQRSQHDTSQESTSKKKKGIHKIIPF